MGRLETIQALDFMSRPCNTKFEWGTNDCCSWVSKILYILYGKDYYAEFKGTYSSRAGLGRLFVRDGVLDVRELTLKVLGDMHEENKPKMGDPVLLKHGEDYILGICCGTYNLYLTEKGTTSAPLGTVVGHWRII